MFFQISFQVSAVGAIIAFELLSIRAMHCPHMSHQIMFSHLLITDVTFNLLTLSNMLSSTAVLVSSIISLGQ